MRQYANVRFFFIFLRICISLLLTATIVLRAVSVFSNYKSEAS